MATKSIKISEETYKKLVEIANKLQSELKKPISIEEAINYIIKRRISDLAGSWEISDEEVLEIKESLKKRWNSWKPSV